MLRHNPRLARNRRWLPVWIAAIGVPLLFAGCASPPRTAGDTDIPPDIARIPDAVPRVEPRARSGNPESYAVLGKTYRVQSSSRGYVERGQASWYGEPFHGRRTSSGETYDMHAMSAAHKTLPLPTYARVTNLDNGRSIVVRINDRGPFHDDRLIDLSHTAAVKLGVVRTGTAPVEIRALDPRRPEAAPAGPFLASNAVGEGRPARPEPPRPPATIPKARPPARSAPVARAPEVVTRPAVARAETPLYLQVGAFGDPGNAERLRARLSGQINHRIQIQDAVANGTTLYRVRIGPLASDRDAERLSRQLAALGLDPPRRVRL